MSIRDMQLSGLIVRTAICLFIGVLLYSAVLAQKQRPLTVDDLMGMETIGDESVSPDSQSIAFVRNRSKLSDPMSFRAWLGADRGDIWIASLAGGVPINITNGAEDGSSFWSPRWSPDGRHLAMISTKGGNVCLWVWDRVTNRLTKLSNRNVTILLVGGQSFIWVDSQRLAAIVLHEGQDAVNVALEKRSAVVAMEEWPKMWAGREATASVLDSGITANLGERLQQEVIVFDLNGKAQTLSSGYSVRNLEISSDGKYIAFLKQTELQRPEAKRLLRYIYAWAPPDRLGYLGARYELSIVDTAGRVVATSNPARFVVPDSFTWSHDSRTFTFIGVYGREEDGPFRVFRGDINGRIEAVDLPAGDARSIVSATNGQFLVSAEHQTENAVGAKHRLAWWLVSRNGAPRSLTDGLKTAPSDLLPESTRRNFIGLADGDVWRVNIDSGAWTNLTAEFEPKVSAITWPNGISNLDTGFNRIIVTSKRGQRAEYYRMDITSGNMTLMFSPSDLARVVTYDPTTDAAIFVADERSGTYFSVVREGGSRTLVEMNDFLRNVAEGKFQQMTYRSSNGTELKAWIILPTDYQSGKRYPMVTWIYSGSMAGSLPYDQVYRLIGLNNGSFLNLQLLSARGYAVLIPSMPVASRSEATDPFLELTSGVLPAVDKAVDIGVADPRRLAVMGHSFGGFGTLGLIEQTNCFQAAIAAAGTSDWISLYGGFSTWDRYMQYPHEEVGEMSGIETGYTSMRNPPWKDWSRYSRNSPLFYADRVQTPVLIVHGDMDAAVDMHQSEEFFSAMYRQGKRARFVRYWGEGHILQSPANIRDFWHQVYSWLDEFCDISRDEKGNLIFDGDKVKSRGGAPPLKPEDFARFNEIELKSHPWVNWHSN